MNRWSSLIRLALGLVLAVSAALPASAQTNPDSTDVNGAVGMPASNCPNINTKWYVAGTVPSGYYKSNADGKCYPIPSCTSNQTWLSGSQTCGCPSGTVWDSSYNTCHAACASGTAWNGSTCASVCSAGTTWNGSTCVSVCSGGQVWNGSACACPSGTVWNGSSCGAPPSFASFSITPQTINIGSGNYAVSWSTNNATSSSVYCTGSTSGSWTLSPASGGHGSLPVGAPGSSDCTGTVTNAYGSVNSSVIRVYATCPSGTSWNGSSCASVCSGGQTWNGSACVCPSGQVWSGSACGIAPYFTGFSVTPSALTIGSGNYTVGWSSAGTGPTSASIVCSGANPGTYALSPASGGSGSVPGTTPGTTSCYGHITSAWGSSSTGTVSVTAACPTGTSWNGSSCKVTSYTPTVYSGLSAVGTAVYLQTKTTVSPSMAGITVANNGTVIVRANSKQSDNYKGCWSGACYQGSPGVWNSSAGTYTYNWSPQAPLNSQQAASVDVLFTINSTGNGLASGTVNTWINLGSTSPGWNVATGESNPDCGSDYGQTTATITFRDHATHATLGTLSYTGYSDDQNDCGF